MSRLGWEALPPDEWASRWGVPTLEVHASIGSTSDRARELAAAGARPFTTVLAAEQSRGRGRSGAGWHSPIGAGLWMSVVLAAPSEGDTALLPLVVGVATARAIERTAGIAVQLKWPNDVLRGGRKLAGVLCETVPDARGVVVAGIGVNLRRVGAPYPDPLAASAAFLEEQAGREVVDQDLAGTLLDEIRGWMDPTRTRFEGPLRSEWEARDCLRGRRVVAEGGTPGVCLGVGADGALQIEGVDGGRRSIRSGSVRLAEPGASVALHSRIVPGAEGCE